MLATQEQAREKWCPHVRETSVAVKFGGKATQNTSTSLGNRYNDFEKDNTKYSNPIGCRCIASDCMMWEWKDDKEKQGYCGLSRLR
jgi:hypothetical protein